MGVINVSTKEAYTTMLNEAKTKQQKVCAALTVRRNFMISTLE